MNTKTTSMLFLFLVASIGAVTACSAAAEGDETDEGSSAIRSKNGHDKGDDSDCDSDDAGSPADSDGGAWGYDGGVPGQDAAVGYNDAGSWADAAYGGGWDAGYYGGQDASARRR